MFLLRPIRSHYATTTFLLRPSCPYKYCATHCAFLFVLEVFMFRNYYGLRSKSSGMSKKGCSQRGCGNGSGRCTSPPPAASDAELSPMKSMVQQSHGVDCSLESRRRGPWQWSSEDTDVPETVGPTSVASAIQLKMMKVAADLSPEEEQTMTTLVLRQWSLYQVLVMSLLRQCSLYYIVIKFLLHASTFDHVLATFFWTCSKFDHVLHAHGDHTTSLSVCTAFLLRCTSSYCVHPIFRGRNGNVAECGGAITNRLLLMRMRQRQIQTMTSSVHVNSALVLPTNSGLYAVKFPTHGASTVIYINLYSSACDSKQQTENRIYTEYSHEKTNTRTVTRPTNY